MHSALVLFHDSDASSSPTSRRSRRSKGCGTCRKRKVKCDEARPICERCHNGFHKCLGYDEPRIFVNSGPGMRFRTASSRKPMHLLESASSSRSAAQHSKDYGIKVPPSLALDGFKDNIVISHLLIKFQVITGGALPKETDAPTTPGILLNNSKTSTAYIAGLSIAEALFGRVHSDESMIHHSAFLYGTALKSLRSDIEHIDQEEVRARSYMNLWSSVFLGMYELMTASTPMSWLEHSRGLSALTRSLGPWAFQQQSARKLFESNRTFIATAGIAQRQRTFLEEEDWKKVPWALDTRPRLIGKLLQDVFCDIPGYMEDADHIRPRGSAVELTCSQDLSLLRAKVVNAFLEVETLRWRWEEEYPHACWRVPVTPDSPSAAGESESLLFPTVFQFASFDRAVESIYFNVTRLLLITLSEQIELSTEGIIAAFCKSGPFLNPLVPPGQGDQEGYALDICQTVPYMVQGDRDSIGALSLLFPLRVASHHLQHRPDILMWLNWVVGKLAPKKGFKLGEHVMKLNRDDQ